MSTEKKNEGLFIVDADVHIKESPAAMAPYCEMPWRRALETQKDAPLPYLARPYLPLGPPFPDDLAYREARTPTEMREGLNIDVQRTILRLAVDLSTPKK